MKASRKRCPCFHQDFSEISSVAEMSRVQTIGEMIAMCAREGTIPCGSMRTPIPSYTDDIDGPIHNPSDKVEAHIDAVSRLKEIQELENTLDTLKEKKAAEDFSKAVDKASENQSKEAGSEPQR